MKHLAITLLIVLFTNVVVSQDIKIETESVTIDNLISFIVDNIGSKEEDSEVDTSNLTFLIQTSKSGISTEDKVILKQAFKLLSNRLTNEDDISILTYSGFNGTALSKTSPKDQKSIAYTLEHIKSSVKEFQKNGIEHAYTFAERHYEEDANNTIIMVRNPKAIHRTEVSVTSHDTLKKKNNVALITAIALLPELISVIKD